MKTQIYLDHHSTTPVDERVLAAMLPYFREHFGNPSSQDHAFGWETSDAVKIARDQVASLIHTSSDEIIFTSGATESNNLAWMGLAKANPTKKHFITCAIEHSAILETARAMEASGYEVTVLSVDSVGKISVSDLEKAIRPDTLLVSIQTANNEVGTLQALREIGNLCKNKKVFFHTDAAQAGAWVPIDVEADGIDLLSLSAHKLYGPKGVGILYVRKNNPRVPLQAISFGGDQERGLRPGTLNVPGIVGMGEACKIARDEMADDAERIQALVELFWSELQKIYPKVSRNGDLKNRLPNNLHVSFPGLEAESIIQHLRFIAVSTGAACDSHKREASHVLRAMKLSADTIHSSLRFGLGRNTTREEITATVNRFREVLQKEMEK